MLFEAYLGYWQFLCGESHKEEDARIVSLASILNIDETMSDLADLQLLPMVAELLIGVYRVLPPILVCFK